MTSIASARLVCLDRATGEPLADQTAVAGVLGWVELHHRAAGFGLVGVHLLEPDALAGSERGDIAAHRERIVVPQDRPEARTVALVGPVHRIVGSKPIEGRMGHTRHVGVMVGDVSVIGPQVGQVAVDMNQPW